MFGGHWTPSVHPSLLMFHIDRPIAQITLLCCPGSLTVVLSLWQRYRNCLDSYRASTVVVPESPITLLRLLSMTTAAVWLLALSWMTWFCTTDCPSRFLLMLDEGGAAETCSNRLRLLSALEIQHGAVLPHQCHVPQWTSPSQHIV